MDLRRVDLNLLVVLQVLLQQRSVTRAAKELNLTQPAVSQALARARAAFDDALLVRDGTSMVPTLRAEALIPRLREALNAIDGLFGAPSFDPATARRKFTLSASDLGELLIVPSIARALVDTPFCSLFVRPVEAFETDDSLDLTVTGAESPHGAFRSVDLFTVRFVILCRHGHPALKGKLPPAEFAALPQVIVDPRSKGDLAPIDETLGKLGLSRRIALRMRSFGTLPSTLAASDLIATVPVQFANRPEVKVTCASRSLPFASPVAKLRLVWHSKFDGDPGHIWLRNQALAAAE